MFNRVGRRKSQLSNKSIAVCLAKDHKDQPEGCLHFFLDGSYPNGNRKSHHLKTRPVIIPSVKQCGGNVGVWGYFAASWLGWFVITQRLHAQLSNGYSSTVLFNWTTVLVPVYVHRRGTELVTEASPMPPCCRLCEKMLKTSNFFCGRSLYM